MLKKLDSNFDKYKLFIDRKKFEIEFLGIKFSYRKIITNCLLSAPRNDDGDIIWDSERLISCYNGYYDKKKNRHKNRVEYLTKEGIVIFTYWYCNPSADKISIAFQFLSHENYPELIKYINEQQAHGAVNLDTMQIDYYKFKPEILTLFAVNIKKAYKRILFDESVYDNTLINNYNILAGVDLCNGFDLEDKSDLEDESNVSKLEDKSELADDYDINAPLKGVSKELQYWMHSINENLVHIADKKIISNMFNSLMSDFSELNTNDLINSINSTTAISTRDDLIKHNKKVLEGLEFIKDDKSLSTKNGYVWIKELDKINSYYIQESVLNTVIFDYNSERAYGLIYDGKNIDVLIEFIKLNFNWNIIEVVKYNAISSTIEIDITTLIYVKTEFGMLKKIRNITIHGKVGNYLIIYMTGNKMIYSNGIVDGLSMQGGDRLEFIGENVVHKYLVPIWSASKSDSSQSESSKSMEVFTKACLLEYGKLSFGKLDYIKNKYGFNNLQDNNNSVIYICKFTEQNSKHCEVSKINPQNKDLYFYAMLSDGTREGFYDISNKILINSVINNYSNGGREIIEAGHYVLALASSETHFIAKYERRVARHNDYYKISLAEFHNNFIIVKELKYVRYQLKADNSIKIYAALNKKNVLSDFRQYLSIVKGDEVKLRDNTLLKDGDYLINFLDSYEDYSFLIPTSCLMSKSINPLLIYALTSVEFYEYFEVDYCVND